MNEVPKHKVFISYFHEDDQEYKNRLVQSLTDKAVDKSVSEGDIEDEGKTVEEIRQIIRDKHIADATVTIVLIGQRTWQRKHVDWEISASLMDTEHNPRCGLIGILLPTHPDHGPQMQEPTARLIPPRLADNISGSEPFAAIYWWPKRRVGKKMMPRIHAAFQRRNRTPPPDNNHDLFANNRTGDWQKGWQN